METYSLVLYRVGQINYIYVCMSLVFVYETACRRCFIMFFKCLMYNWDVPIANYELGKR